MQPLRVSAVALALAAGALASPAAAQVNARMLREPAVSATQIAFVYGGDIWIMPKAGGVAQRLTSAPGEESFPKFSPDGSLLAYTANYDGNADVYVIPANGGSPTRVTWHPADDRVAAWYPDGKSLLIASSRASETNRYNKLFKVSKDGGLPEALPMPYGEFGSLSPDATQIAYLPEAVDARTWKRYRGGWAPDIWIFDLAKGTAKNVTNDNANDAQPMWHGSTIYFLSDRGTNMRGNIWSYDTKTGAFAQLTDYGDYDVKYPSLGPSDIVFQEGDGIYLLDLATGKTHEVPVRVVTDRSTLRPRPESVGQRITGGDISPTGKRAVFDARGDVFTVPAEHGLVKDLSNTSSSAERYPTWSPDGGTIAYWSDKTGEYQLTLRPADGSGEERTVTKLGPGFRYQPFWSPDSKSIVFVDQTGTIGLLDVATGGVKKIDQALSWSFGNEVNFRPSWSADSRWVAYARDLKNQNTAIFLYDTKSGAARQVTSGYYADASPEFDPDGKYLFFLSGRTFAPSYSDLQNTWIYANTTNIVAVPLRKDVASPLAPRDDEEAAAAGDSAKAKGDSAGAKGAAKMGGEAKNGEKSAKAAPKEVNIDLDDFERRLVVLPPKAGNYDQLQAVSGKVLYHRQRENGVSEGPTPIVAYDLAEREEKPLVDNAQGFIVSADGKKMLVFRQRNVYIVEVKPGQKLDKPLETAAMTMTVDPQAEWHQIFNDAWRIERDFFYDPGMHGVDWNAMRTRYGKLIDDAVSRYDVSFVLGELIAELNSSHTYNGGGDYPDEPRRGVGLLGADYALENGAYRITRIIDGGAWDDEVRSPLMEPGVNVKAGEYLLAVNGRPLDTAQEPAAAFQGLANTDVQITVNDKPTMAGARTVLVKTLGSEGRLRNLAWIEANRKRVDEVTHGRVGYVYVPSTGVNGQTELVRQYRAQIDKDGMIIDERFNSGGQIPDRFVELLNRPVTNYWKTRDGDNQQWPPIAQRGPKVMLINGWSGSGGDAFPFYFREAKLGPLIGRRTWGGLIGISGTPQLVDGGNVTAPSFAIYSTDGKWIIEGHGVDPDIDVVDDPAEMAKGVDPQLERAIAEVMKAVEKTPPPAHAPAYTKRIAPR